MELMLLVLKVAVWLATSGGGAPVQEDLEECIRGQIVPC